MIDKFCFEYKKGEQYEKDIILCTSLSARDVLFTV